VIEREKHCSLPKNEQKRRKNTCKDDDARSKKFKNPKKKFKKNPKQIHAHTQSCNEKYQIANYSCEEGWGGVFWGGVCTKVEVGSKISHKTH